uniref:Uncharacterized protein n=1 Tax=Arundo donax TaxID=35708 RepID=A0A0A9A9X5_ARUDO
MPCPVLTTQKEHRNSQIGYTAAVRSSYSALASPFLCTSIFISARNLFVL